MKRKFKATLPWGSLTSWNHIICYHMFTDPLLSCNKNSSQETKVACLAGAVKQTPLFSAKSISIQAALVNPCKLVAIFMFTLIALNSTVFIIVLWKSEWDARVAFTNFDTFEPTYVCGCGGLLFACFWTLQIHLNFFFFFPGRISCCWLQLLVDLAIVA